MQVGFDAVYFGRIDYQDRAKRKVEKSLEVVWRGSKTLGSSSQVNYRFSFPPSLSSFLFIEGEAQIRESAMNYFHEPSNQIVPTN